MTTIEANPNRFSQTLSQVRAGTTTITRQQAMLGDCLNRASVDFDFDFTVEREAGKFPYRIDLLAYDRPKSRAVLGCEAFGDGTKCDDVARHAFIVSKGIPLVYFPNKLIELFPGRCVSEIRDYFAVAVVRRYF